MRTLLRRRIMEETADDWSDNDLNVILNTAYALIAKQVRKVDPEFLMHWEYRDTVAGTSWYEKPEGTRGMSSVGIKGSASDTDYTWLRRTSHRNARENTNTSEQVYCIRGKYLGIFPAPTTSVTEGLEIIHAPTPTLSADTDVPEVEETLHTGIVCWAAMLTLGESPEDDSKHANELRRVLAEIPDDYGSDDLGQPRLLEMDCSDARGKYGAQINNDTDPGRSG
jgi:hypothetical protein